MKHIEFSSNYLKIRWKHGTVPPLLHNDDNDWIGFMWDIRLHLNESFKSINSILPKYINEIKMCIVIQI